MKLASIHIWSSGTTAISLSPIATCLPSCTLRWATMPPTGARMVVRCASSAAARRRSWASVTSGWVSGVTPSTWACAARSAACATASAARAAFSASAAWRASSDVMAPCAAMPRRAETSAWARSSSAWRRATSAPAWSRAANSACTRRRARARSARAPARAIWVSAGSTSTSVWPARMRSALSAQMAETAPPTCGVMATT
ncbi:hypothetical protein WJ977_31200 [Achromobacter xylosoxidans]